MASKPRSRPVPGDTQQALERLKHASTLQLLMRAARLSDELGRARVNAGAGRTRVRPGHTRLLPHITFEGTRMTEIAQRLGVTKQAVGQAVAELERDGIVEVVPDPDDRRAKRVRFTRRGAKAMEHGLGILTDLEAELMAALGPDDMAALRRGLVAVLPVLEQLLGPRVNRPER